jgi:hypothetical protein
MLKFLCGPFYHFFNFLVGNYSSLSIIFVITLPMHCLAPCPVFVLGAPGLLATGSCCWVVWGLTDWIN